MLTGTFKTLYDSLLRSIPRERLIHDDLRTLAYGSDASFYRLIPKLIVKADDEAEIISVLNHAGALKLPMTFRAAGTSLSGQAISDSVLVVLGSNWKRQRIAPDASSIRLQAGVIGASANLWLAPFGRKIGPDPASINAATVGGIAANNASGMCCGTAHNSYKTLAGMRLILRDGTILDTNEPDSRSEFIRSHSDFVSSLSDLARRVRTNATLAARIRGKYAMKNTTGYSLNALVDFEDPIEIIQHLMIGSEGTLGFISEITYSTVPELPRKASALMLFPDIENACRAVAILKHSPVDAVELMDRAALRSVEKKEGMPDIIAGLGTAVASLLVETRAADSSTLHRQIREITEALTSLPKVRPIEFTSVPAEFARLWDVRKGLFPSVGAMRKTGTTVIIEDVAFPIPRLAEATLELQTLFQQHGYHDAIIFGHALEGNLHFVFSQDFNSPGEVQRYARFIADVTSMVVRRYDGSLKAEHGTGRNMAPFVELEWGAEAFSVMREIKQLFDPGDLLNPGVIINPDRLAHLKDLKPLPTAHPIVDKCIECGFCEVHCPSRDLTLTPRQRIVAYREISRLAASGENLQLLESLRSSFDYLGNQTCATDGLCATACPVDIDTGKLVKDLRSRSVTPFADKVATFLSRNMDFVTAGMRVALNAVGLFHGLAGTPLMSRAARLARVISAKKLPLWNPYMPKGADRLPEAAPPQPGKPTVVYFPTCINRAMGTARGDGHQQSLTGTTTSLLRKAGYNVVFPEGLANLCCGMAFASKGFKAQGDRKAAELQEALRAASRNGADPILVDMSPCLYRMKETFGPDLHLYEPVKFTLEHLAGRLTFRRMPVTVAIHTTCSARKMALEGDFARLAQMCAERVVAPEGIECCGWAGDRGFTFPELNESALRDLKAAIPPDCHEGYSTSRTCEIGLSLHSGIHYASILYLVDTCTSVQEPDRKAP